MTITPELRAMLERRRKAAILEEAERRAFEKSERRWNRIGAVLFARIDRAAPFIDAGCPPDKWSPSALLKIMYCAAATGDRAEGARDAAIAVLDILELARERFRSGLHPNPFLEQAA
jgi:hypothetical protein